MNIAFYISDMGYGHATREIAVIRELLRHKRVNVFARTHTPFGLVKRSFEGAKRAAVADVQNDVGTVNATGGMGVDAKKTHEAVIEWLKGWDAYNRKEKAFCKKEKIDLIAADIAPQPFLVAESLGLPSIGLSNFTWDWIYSAIFGEDLEVEQMREAYRAASLGVLFPFSFEAHPFRKTEKVGLAVRRRTRGREEMRKLAGAKPSEMITFCSFGFSTDIRKVATPKKARLMMPSSTATEGAIKVPESETESQDWIGACDLLLSKGSYGVVSEAMQAEVPMLLASRPGFVESDIFIAECTRLGIAVEVTEQEAVRGSWEEKAEEAIDCKKNYRRLPDLYRRDGAKEAADLILKHLK